MNADETLDDLCRRLADSDRSALEVLFRTMRPRLLRYVGSIVRADDVPHDLVQDVFVALWELRTTLDPARSLQAYLYRMARNRAYRYLRDERGHAEKHREILSASASEGPQDDGLEERLDGGLLAKQLRGWIEGLPERQREALVLSRYHDLSHREIAAVMEVSPRTVNNHIVRALEHLQHRLHAFEATPSQP